MTNRVCVLAIIALAATLGVSPGLAAPQSPAAKGTGQATATPGSVSLSESLKEFQKQLDGYVKLRGELIRKIRPLSTTPSATDLGVRQAALASAIKAARDGARQGDLINPVVAAHITRIVTADARRRSPAAESAALKEVARAPRPVINKTYPADAALPTVPPLLLSELPRLPDNLQYRFFGRHVAILDGDVQIILDFVADALPPH